MSKERQGERVRTHSMLPTGPRFSSISSKSRNNSINTTSGDKPPRMLKQVEYLLELKCGGNFINFDYYVVRFYGPEYNYLRTITWNLETLQCSFPDGHGNVTVRPCDTFVSCTIGKNPGHVQLDMRLTKNPDKKFTPIPEQKYNPTSHSRASDIERNSHSSACGASFNSDKEDAPVNMDGSIRTIKSHSPDMKDMINKDKYKDDKGNNINHRASPINVNDDINGRGLVRINDGKRGISFGPSDNVDDIDNMKLLHKGSGSPRRGVLRSRGGEIDKRSTTPNKTLAPGGIIVLDQPKSKKVISINPSDLDDYSDINENNNIDGIKRRPKKHKVQF